MTDFMTSLTRWETNLGAWMHLTCFRSLKVSLDLLSVWPESCSFQLASDLLFLAVASLSLFERDWGLLSSLRLYLPEVSPPDCVLCSFRKYLIRQKPANKTKTNQQTKKRTQMTEIQKIDNCDKAFHLKHSTPAVTLSVTMNIMTGFRESSMIVINWKIALYSKQKL